MYVHSLIAKTFLFQATHPSQTVPIQTIQFSISMQFSSIWLIDRAPSDVTTQGLSRPGSNGSERGAPYSPKPQHHWNLTIRLFSVT